MLHFCRPATVEFATSGSVLATVMPELVIGQTELPSSYSYRSQSRVRIEIAKNHGEAELEQARMRAEQTVVDAEAEHRKHLLIAEAEGKAKALLGEGESTRVALEGDAQATVLRKQIESYGDPRLYAVSMVSKHLAQNWVGRTTLMQLPLRSTRQSAARRDRQGIAVGRGSRRVGRRSS